MVSSDKRLQLLKVSILIVFVVGIGFVLLRGIGVIGDSGGPTYVKMKENQNSALEDLKAKGAKCELKRYPQGDAYSINLSGVPVTDEIFERVKEAAPVSELFLSGSGVTDAHAAIINEPAVGGFLTKLDVSKSEFSDAGLAQLKSLNLLMELNVTGTKVTPEGINKFQESRIGNVNIMPMLQRVTIKK